MSIGQLDFTIYQLEKELANKDYEKLENNLLFLFKFADHGGSIEAKAIERSDGGFDLSHHGLLPLNSSMSLKEKRDWCTRLATVITQYLSDTEIDHSDSFLVTLTIYKNMLMNIFYISAYSNMDHILYNRGLMSWEGALNLSGADDIKYFLTCHTLNSSIAFDPKIIFDAMPVWSVYWYFGHIYGLQHPFNSNIEKNLNIIVSNHNLIKSFELDSTSAEMLASPWMLCSYWDNPEHHEIKKSMNVALKNWLEKNISPKARESMNANCMEVRSVKRITVILEKYRSDHAVYRCFHGSVEQLKNQYEVTAISSEEDIDEKSAADFHSVKYVSASAEHIKTTIEVVASTKPDLVLYLSLGMAKWTIALCNVRFAPIQVMSYGHPASAFSKEIDYGLASGFSGANFGELALEKPTPVQDNIEIGGKQNITPHPEYRKFKIKKPQDGVVRIAVNSSLQKITSRFVNLCRLAIEHSSVSIEFHFFMIVNREFLNYAWESSLIERLGGKFIIHWAAPYMEYMLNLSRCDLAIGTFPFGGSNSNVDLLLLNIPKIVYNEKNNLASFTDDNILRRFELPSILFPENEGDLLSNFIYLIHDSKMRAEISESIQAQEPEERLFGKSKFDPETQGFIEKVRWMEMDSLRK